MITRKLKNFEYAGFKSGAEGTSNQADNVVDAFETPNGFVLVAAAARQPGDNESSNAETICQRIRYYLENELHDDPAEALLNSLVYTNGFVYEANRKDDNRVIVDGSVSCLLIKDSRVFFGWMGEASFMLFNGKRVYSLGWDLTVEPEGETPGDNGKKRLLYLGNQQIAEPAVCEQPLVPVNGDIVVAGVGKSWEVIKAKAYNGVLSDSMPTLNKAQRLVGIATETLPQDMVALQVVSFYNLENQRPLPPPVQPDPSLEKEETIDENQPTSKNRFSLKKSIVITICLLAVVYMFYDLFLKDPVSIVNVDTPIDQSVLATQDETEGKIAETQQTTANLPPDMQYAVKSGDTWPKIWREFEVCSWFIKNHPPNSGKFDDNENPITGKTIAIPVKYSGSKKHNPDYHQDFSLDKLGRTCQNANQDYREAFEKKVNR